METAKPTLSQAEEFADGVHAKWPGKMLAYNLSPSFNWDAAGMTDEQIERFTCDLGRRGFVWQFITLAGFHTNGLAIHNFVNGYAEKGKCSSTHTTPSVLPTHHSPLTPLTTHHSHHSHHSPPIPPSLPLGMAAYNSMIQREERKNGVALIKHQHWSGAELMDAQMQIATGGSSSTSSMGAGVTEAQFVAAAK